MTITITKQQPGSWSGKYRRQLSLATRVSAADWDAIFDIADNRQCGTRRLIREALREYIERHHPASREALRIEVRGRDGRGLLGKLVKIFDGGNEAGRGDDPGER